MDHLAFAVNIGAALLMGMAIGIERQLGQHPAGLRTNTLVCVGAAIFVSLGHILVHDGDPTRVAGQVVSGIGFLGGGVILREGFNVRGMNTAATLWCSAAVGTLAGVGLLAEASIATAAILVVHTMLRPLVHWLDDRAKLYGVIETCYHFNIVCKEEHAGLVRAICLRHIHSQPGMLIHGISTKEIAGTSQATVVVNIFSSVRNDKYLNDLVQRLIIEHDVTSASWERVV